MADEALPVKRSKIKNVTVTEFNDEFVYDIVMKDSSTPYFFANDVLVHNSCYFLTRTDNKHDAIAVANDVADYVNQAFPDFLRRAFLCQPWHDERIVANREIVGERGLFIAKKKYVIKVVDNEGKAVNKLKTMGSEIKKSDTPRPIQNFLKEVVSMILDGKTYSELEAYVNSQRKAIFTRMKMMDVIDIGVSKSVNNLKEKYDDYLKYEKPGHKRVNLPGHVRAAINFNELGLRFEGSGATMLQSGDKVKVFYLRPNDLDLTSIAFPSDITHFPQWFLGHFRVDRKLTEEKMIDAKLEAIFTAWGHPIPNIQRAFQKTVLKFK